MNELTSSLWISDAAGARNLSNDHQFDEVVSLGYMDYLGLEQPEASTTGDSLVFKDGPHEYDRFATAVDYVLNALNQDDTVLVHCQAGISRSGGVCSTVLAIQNEIPVDQALSHVQEARPDVNPESEIRASMKRYIDEYTVEAVQSKQ